MNNCLYTTISKIDDLFFIINNTVYVYNSVTKKLTKSSGNAKGFLIKSDILIKSNIKDLEEANKIIQVYLENAIFS